MRARPFKDPDLDHWLRMRRARWPRIAAAEHREAAGRILANRLQNAVLVGCGENDRPVAFAELSMRRSDGAASAPAARLEALYVDEEHRRSRLAAALVEAAEAWASARGCRELSTETGLDDETAQRVCTALGFEEIGRRVVFRKAIEAPPAALPGAVGASEPSPARMGEPTAPPSRRLFSSSRVFTVAVAVVGAISLAHSDISSPDLVEGVLLPLVDTACVLYLMAAFALWRYRVRTDERNRRDELFSSGEPEGD